MAKVSSNNSTNDSVINVQIIGDASSLEQAFNLSDAAAKKFATSLASSLKTAVTSAGAKELQGVTSDLINEAKKARQAMTDMGLFKYDKTLTGLGKIKSELQQIANISQTIGKNLAVLEKLDKVTKQYNSQSKKNLATEIDNTPATIGVFDYQADAKNFGVAVDNKISSLERLSGRERQLEALARGRETQRQQQALKDEAKQRQLEGAAKGRAVQVLQHEIGIYAERLKANTDYNNRLLSQEGVTSTKYAKVIEEANKKIAAAEKVSAPRTLGDRYRSAFSNANATSSYTTLTGANVLKGVGAGIVAGGKDIYAQVGEIASKVKDVSQKATEAFKSQFSKIKDIVGDTAIESKSRFAQIFAANFFAGLAYNAVSQIIFGLKEVSVETVKYAARTEELGVALTSLAKVNNISKEAIDQQEVSIKRLNITTQDARESLARFINVGFDIKDAAPLARVAQDLAVIGGLSTSEELDKLIVGIQTLQSRNLRTAGVYITVDETLDKLSATTGRARDSFSTLEKQQAVLNAVMDYGSKVAGTYTASMTTAAKQARSLEREFFEAQNSIGTAFIPVMQTGITVTSGLLQAITKFPDAFTRAIGVITLFSASLIALKTNAIQGVVTGVRDVAVSGIDALRGLSGRPTQKSLENAELTKRLILQKEINSLDRQETILALRKLSLEERLTTVAGQRLALRAREQRVANIDLKNQIKNVGIESTGDKIAGAIGKATAVLAGVALIYEIGKTAYEAYNAPFEIKNQDVNQIKKQAQETRELEATRTKIIQDQNSNVANMVNLKKVESDVTTKINQQQTVSLTLLQLQTGEIEKQKGLLDTIDSQLAANRTIRQTEIDTAGLNVVGQFENLSRAQTSNLELATNVQNIQAQRKRLYGNASDAELQARLNALGGEGIRPSEKFLVEGQNSEASTLANILANKSKLDAFADSSQKAREEQAKLFSVVKDSAEIAAAYGLTIDDVLQPQAEAKFGKNTEALKKFNEEINRLKKQILDDTTKKAIQGFLSPEERLNEISTDFNTKRQEFINKVKDYELAKLQTDNSANGYSESVINDRIAKSVDIIKNSGKIFDESYGKSKEDVEAFFSAVTQGISRAEAEGKTFTYQEKLTIIQEEFKKITASNPSLVASIVNSGNAIKNNTDLAKNYALSLINLRNELSDVSSEYERFISQSPEERKIAFEIENKRNQLNTAKSITRLEGELGKEPTNLSRFNDLKSLIAYEESLKRQQKIQNDINAARLRLKELQEGVNPELEKLNREVKVQESIYTYKNKIKDVEDEINALKVTSTLPAINSELLIQKQLLQNVQDRKQAEQQLTADIAVEINKRTKLGIEANNLVAQVFLDLQKEETSSQTDLVKNYLKYQASNGDTSAFKNNPLIQEAVKQSDNLKSIEEKGGITAIAIQEGNIIAKGTSNNVVEAGKNIVSSLGTVDQTLKDNLEKIFGAVSQHQALTVEDVKGTWFDTGNFSTKYSGNGAVSDSIKNSMSSLFGSKSTGSIPFNKIYNAFVGQESGGNYRATNNKTGATGLGQILPQYFQSYANLAGMSGTTFEEYKSNPQVQQKIVYGALQNLYGQALKMANGNPQEAVRMLASRWYSGSFKKSNNYNKFNLAEPSIGEYADSVLRRTGTASNRLSSFTSRVVSDTRVANVTKPANPKQSILKLVNDFGLSIDEVASILGIKPVGLTSRRTITDKNLSDLTTLAPIKNAFGTINTGFSLEASGKAASNFFDEQGKLIKDLELSKATRALRAIQSAVIIASETSTELEKFATEIEEELNFGQARRNVQDAIASQRLSSLKTNGGVFRQQAFGELRSQRILDEINLEKEQIKLEEELFYRREEGARRASVEEKKYNLEKQNGFLQIQDAIEKAKRDANFFGTVEGRLEIDNKVYAERLTNNNSLNEELYKAQKDADTQYALSVENRTNLDKQYRLDRLKEETDTINQILKLELQIANVREGMYSRLALKQKQIELDKKKEFEANLISQLELEESYRRRFDEFDPTVARNGILGNINGAMKTQTELITGIWNDSFNSINSGFGGLVDKMTARLGVFGEAIGNVLKGIFGNILGKVTKGLLDKVFPQASELANIPNLTGTTTENKAPESLLSIAGASSTTTNAIYQLGVASMQVAQSMIQSAATSGGYINTVQGVLSSGNTGGRGSAISSGASSSIGFIGSLLGGLGGGTASVAQGGFGLSLATLRGQAGINTGNVGRLTLDPATSSISSNPVLADGGANPVRLLAEKLNINLGNGSGGSKGLAGLANYFGLKDIGKSIAAAGPSIGAGFGGLLGGQSGVGRALGTIGGGVAGILGGAIGTSLIAGTGALGTATTGLGGIGAALGISGAATLGIGLAIAGVFLLGSWLFGRAKRNKIEKQNVNQWSNDALTQMKDLLKGVQTDKIDGDEAITRAGEIVKNFQDQIATLKSKDAKKIGQQKLSELTGIQSQIKAAADAQLRRRELNDKIVPTYATGGMSEGRWIKVSKGETLYSPDTIPYMSDAFSRAKIPGFNSSYGTKGNGTIMQIGGRFDGKDNILMNVPKGTIIANPAQQKIIATGYNSGGVQGVVSYQAAQGSSATPPPAFNVIVAIGEEEAKKLGEQIPNSVIIKAVSRDIKQRGLEGLAGQVYNTFNQ